MMNRYRIPLFWLLLLMAVLAPAAEIHVAVDRNPVTLNDSFRIIFSAGEEPDAKPDFSPLEDNFQILDQQRSSSTSWVNGQLSRQEQWTLSVMAKRAGELLIPPVAFGADTSRPLKVTVNDNGDDAEQPNEELFLSVEATPEKTYVQSQVLYTLKFYHRLQITQASLNEPEVKDALVERLGDDVNYLTQIQGVDYWVTERKYAIFPQQSGLVTIAPLTLTAEVVGAQRPRFNGFFNRQVTETRRVSSKAITLNVLPVPADYKSPVWLSAESVQLSEKWSADHLQTRVGEPLTRTLTLTAKGSTVGQLPELFGQTALDGIKTYPDQPVLKEDKQGDGLTALREEKIAFIPSKPGDYTLPAIEIAWFNTKTQAMEMVRLPAVTLKALPPAGEAEKTPPAAELRTEPGPNGELLVWQALSGFLALGWLLTVIFFYRRPKAKVLAESVVSVPRETGIEKDLQRACRENDAEAAKLALLQWGKVRFEVESLGALAEHCGPELREAILALNRHLYAGNSGTWQGKALGLAFNAERSAVADVAGGEKSTLEPLFKL